MRKITKHFILGLALVSVAGVLTGCSKGKDDPNELEIYIANAGYGYQWAHEIKNVFLEQDWVKEKYPDLKITIFQNDDFTYAETVLNAGQASNRYDLLISMNLNSDTNRVMSAHSVNLKRKVTSGEISNLSGDSKNIYFTASNYNDIDFKLKSGQVRTFYDNGTTEISKIGYNRYKLSLGESYNVSAGERITLGDLYVADINEVRHSFELNEVNLYFTGSTWVNIKSLDQIDIRMNIAYTATFINGTVSNDRVFMKFSVSDLYTEELSSIGEYGIQVSTSSQTRRYPVENLRLDTVNNERYLIIDLGDAISQNRYNDIFTVTAYLKVGETVITSTNTSSGSIFTLVEAMYNNVATQNFVTNLYNYMK